MIKIQIFFHLIFPFKISGLLHCPFFLLCFFIIGLGSDVCMLSVVNLARGCFFSAWILFFFFMPMKVESVKLAADYLLFDCEDCMASGMGEILILIRVNTLLIMT